MAGKTGTGSALRTSWTKEYPPKTVLRDDIGAMADAAVNVAVREFGRASMERITLTGSASKPWESVIDYVPGISDVDVHIEFRGSDLFSRRVRDVRSAIRYALAMEEEFKRLSPNPYHVPILQLHTVNGLRKREGYMETPRHSITTLLGSAPRHGAVKADMGVLRSLVLQNREFVRKFPLTLSDKTMESMDSGIRKVSGKMGSTAASALCLLGVPYDDAFGSNRTRVTRKLTRLGHGGTAREFAAFYLYGWRHHMDRDFPSLRDCLSHGHAALKGLMRIAEEGRDALE